MKSEKLGPATLPNRKVSWATVEEEQAERQKAAEAHLQVLRQQLGALLEKLQRISDPRRPGSIRHKLTVLLVYGVLLFVFQLSSRREANRELGGTGFWEVLRVYFPELDTIPHADTLARLLEEIPPEAIERVLQERIRSLLRHGKLRALMVDNRYVVAIDGTQKFARDWQWASEALRRTHQNQKVSYRAYVLEAVLVCPQGIRIPLATEFCANDPEASVESKQDCELKAFARLAKRLKEAFPKLRLLLALDGLYPNGPIFEKCRHYCWDYMIVLPDDSLPTVWEEAEGLRHMEPENSCVKVWGERNQKYWWVNQIEYEYGQPTKRILVNVVVCEESWQITNANGQVEERHARHAWISGSPLNEKNLHRRCNLAARHRWDIEEHILVEKHQGYQYEHAFSLNWKALQCWHHLMHLGHFLNTLANLTLTLWNSVQKRGFRGTVRFLWETYIGRWLDLTRLRLLLSKKPQLRLII